MVTASVGCAAFSILFGADLIGCFSTFFITLLAIYSFRWINSISENSIISTTIIGAIIGLSTIILFEFNLLKTKEVVDGVIIGAIMVFLPGVAITKSASDLLTGDLISGVSRVFEACLIALALAVGLGSIVMCWISMGGGF